MEFYDKLNDRLQENIKLFHDEYATDLVSIKIKAESGCFHRSCCPNALKTIEDKIYREQDNHEYKYIEHESGPELIAYLGLTAAGLAIAKSIIDLITTIIKARFDGQKKGDNHKGIPITLVIRKTTEDKKVIEERIMTFHEKDKADNKIIEELLLKGYLDLKEKENKIE